MQFNVIYFCMSKLTSHNLYNNKMGNAEARKKKKEEEELKKLEEREKKIGVAVLFLGG